MQAKDIMTSPVVTVSTDTPVAEIARVLLSRRISAVPVVDGGDRPLGMVSEGDLMRRADSGTERRPAWWLALLASPDEAAREYVRTHGGKAGDVMSAPVISITEDTPVNEIAHKLESAHIKRVPVLRDGRIAGIVSRADLLRALASARPEQPAILENDRKLGARVEAAIEAIRVPTEFVTVIAANGEVHLWGAAESDDIRKAVRVAAEEAAGGDRVHDHLRVLSANLRALLWV